MAHQNQQSKPATEMTAEEIKSNYEGKKLRYEQDGELYGKLSNVDIVTGQFVFEKPDGTSETLSHRELFDMLKAHSMTFADV